MTVNLTRWLKEEKLKSHKTSPDEISKLFRIVDRDLADAEIKGLSTDRRFITAYNAALQLATIALRIKGFRTNPNKAGHHRISFDALTEIFGKELEELSDYLHACRVKRNICDYTSSDEISAAQSIEIIKEVKGFRSFVVKWIKSSHPQFYPK